VIEFGTDATTTFKQLLGEEMFNRVVRQVAAQIESSQLNVAIMLFDSVEDR
jgi:hypothetical protein